MEKQHPIENLMMTAMNSIQNMVDVNTIVGEPIETTNNIIIIPISKVGFGFAAGGSEFKGETVDEYTKREKEEAIQYRLPFGGGSGAGVSITPVAFLVVQQNNVKLLPVSHCSSLDRLLDYVPDLMQKMNDMFNKKISQKEEKDKKILYDLKSKKCKDNITNIDKSAEVQGQEQKVQENEEKMKKQNNIEITESDGEVFGEE